MKINVGIRVEYLSRDLFFVPGAALSGSSWQWIIYCWRYAVALYPDPESPCSEHGAGIRICGINVVVYW